jgi:hypothetical protein
MTYLNLLRVLDQSVAHQSLAVLAQQSVIRATG